MKKITLLLLVFLIGSVLWAQNRYALVIGNSNYERGGRLPNAINDTNDISSALRELGYQVVLRQNLNRADMVREIDAFVSRLNSNANSEGFFWYAGHAMQIEGESYILPINVDLQSEISVKNTSFSINTFTEQLNRIRNKINVIVLDACRAPPELLIDQEVPSLISSIESSGGEVYRVIRPIQLTSPDLYLIYSTAPGTLASDGVQGSRNSPFAQAFLNNIKSTDPLIMMIAHVTSDTLGLTNQRQRPFTSGSMGRDNINYSLNPAGRSTPEPPVPAFVTVPGSTLTEKFNWIRNNAASNTKYLIEVNRNENIPPQELRLPSGRNNVSITLRGVLGVHTINLSENGRLFNIRSGITLVLENITLVGRINNSTHLIEVGSGGNLTMNTGSTVMGNTGGGLFVTSEGSCYMYAGTITGNRGFNGDALGRAGYFGAVFNAGYFEMHGGTIFNNIGGTGGNGGNASSLGETGDRAGRGGCGGVTNTGRFIMFDGSITNNNGGAGGVGGRGGDGNNINGNGGAGGVGGEGGIGGVYNSSSGIFHMYGGIVNGNSGGSGGMGGRGGDGAVVNSRLAGQGGRGGAGGQGGWSNLRNEGTFYISDGITVLSNHSAAIAQRGSLHSFGFVRLGDLSTSPNPIHVINGVLQ